MKKRRSRADVGERDRGDEGDGGGGDADDAGEDEETETSDATTTDQQPMSGVVVADADGRPARSSWRVVETFFSGGAGAGEAGGKKTKKTSPSVSVARATCSLVEVKPHTGRKHQVRQHMGLALDALSLIHI